VASGSRGGGRLAFLGDCTRGVGGLVRVGGRREGEVRCVSRGMDALCGRVAWICVCVCVVSV